MGFSVALFDLIAPYILRGTPVGALHAILSIIYVHEYEAAFADDGVVLRGRAKYSGDVGIDPPFFDPLTGSFGFGGLPLDLQVQLDLTGGTECLAYTASVSIDCTPAP